MDKQQQLFTKAKHNMKSTLSQLKLEKMYWMPYSNTVTPKDFPKKQYATMENNFLIKTLITFAKNNGITMKHRALATPATQGLIKQSNRTFKEDMHNLIVATATKGSG